MSDATPTTTTDRQVLISRVFDAPREQVFNAWIDPTELAEWYGPAEVEVPRERINVDARVGGRWELTMVRRGDGREMSIGYEIIELVEGELLVMRSDPMPEAGMHEGTLLRLEVADLEGKTRMTLTDGPYPSGGRDHAEGGWNAAFDKLAARIEES
jgi:uncharacterized protein YndB with AHSA1/START domain